jgi:hypothetical protein
MLTMGNSGEENLPENKTAAEQIQELLSKGFRLTGNYRADSEMPKYFAQLDEMHRIYGPGSNNYVTVYDRDQEEKHDPNTGKFFPAYYKVFEIESEEANQYKYKSPEVDGVKSA